MGAFFQFILGLLVPPDPGPWDLVPGAQDQKQVEEVKKAMRIWQWGISGIVAFVVLILAGSAFSNYGFALAADSANKTEAAVKPLADSVAKIQVQLAQNESANQQMLAVLNELRAASIAVNIDRLVRRRCLEQDLDEVNSLRRDIDLQKAVYTSLAKVEYTEPTCAEVRR
jgi:hypothetical protein